MGKPLTQQQLEDLQIEALKKAIEKMLNGNKKK